MQPARYVGQSLGSGVLAGRTAHDLVPQTRAALRSGAFFALVAMDLFSAFWLFGFQRPLERLDRDLNVVGKGVDVFLGSCFSKQV
jgi:hypothetical protein